MSTPGEGDGDDDGEDGAPAVCSSMVLKGEWSWHDKGGRSSNPNPVGVLVATIVPVFAFGPCFHHAPPSYTAKNFRDVPCEGSVR